MERKKRSEQDERLKQEKTFKVECKLKEMCDNFNCLKERINHLSSFEPKYGGGSIINIDIETTHDSLDRLEKELRSLNEQIEEVQRDYGLDSGSITSDSCLFDGMDQAAQTQFNLLKSFSTYVNTQLGLKRESFLKVGFGYLAEF